MVRETLDHYVMHVGPNRWW